MEKRDLIMRVYDWEAEKKGLRPPFGASVAEEEAAHAKREVLWEEINELDDAALSARAAAVPADYDPDAEFAALWGSLVRH